MFFNLTNRTGQQPTLTIFGSFGEKVITTTHPFFKEVRDYLTETPEDQHDEDRMWDILDPVRSLGSTMAAVDPRVSYDSGSIYLDGIRVHSLIEKHIVDRARAGDTNWDRLVRFLIKVDENPSRKAQEAIYQWINRHGIHLAEDGDFVAYKGVDSDGRSSHAGPNNFIDGVLFGTPGHPYKVPHEVGTVISKKRADVDDNTALACSTGLHVGTYDYAKGFASILRTVKVNPRDVVSVPDSDLTFKIRVCRYEVIADNPANTQFMGFSYNPGDEAVTEKPALDADPAAQILWAEEQPVQSREHVWHEDEQAQYDSLKALGRTLYDNLRTQFDWSHDDAYEAALDRFGENEALPVIEANTDDGPNEERLYEQPDEGIDLLPEDEGDFQGIPEAEESETYREIPTLDEEDVPVAETTEVDGVEVVTEFIYDTLAEAEDAESDAVLSVLNNPAMGHKPAARYLVLHGLVNTTESSVRRWRKAHEVTLG